MTPSDDLIQVTVQRTMLRGELFTYRNTRYVVCDTDDDYIYAERIKDGLFWRFKKDKLKIE